MKYAKNQNIHINPQVVLLLDLTMKLKKEKEKVKEFADHGLPTNVKRPASQRSPAKITPQSKRQKKADHKSQDDQPQDTNQTPSRTTGNNSSSLNDVPILCKICEDLPSDQRCVWLVLVKRQEVKYLEGSVLTCADAKDRLPPVVSLHITSYKAKFNLTCSR